MASEILCNYLFDDMCDLEEALGYLLTEYFGQDTTDDYPIILVEDSNGNPLNRAQLHEQILTDGSKVYKIVLDRTGA